VRRDAENDITCGNLGGEVRLRDIAARCIGTPGDHIKLMHLAIGCAIRVSHETRFADRTMQSYKRRHDIVGALQGRDRHLRIGAWACAADGGLHVATGTLIEIVSRAQAWAAIWRANRSAVVQGARYGKNLRKKALGGGEKTCSAGDKIGKRASGPGRTAAYTWVGLSQRGLR
jgi:hypothetical protein